MWKKVLSVRDEFHICMCTKDTGDNEYEKAEDASFDAVAPVRTALRARGRSLILPTLTKGTIYILHRTSYFTSYILLRTSYHSQRRRKAVHRWRWHRRGLPRAPRRRMHLASRILHLISQGTLSPKCSIKYKGVGCCLVDRKVIDWGEMVGMNAYTVTMAAGVDPVRDRQTEHGDVHTPCVARGANIPFCAEPRLPQMLMIAFVAIKDKIAETN